MNSDSSPKCQCSLVKYSQHPLDLLGWKNAFKEKHNFLLRELILRQIGPNTLLYSHFSRLKSSCRNFRQFCQIDLSPFFTKLYFGNFFLQIDYTKKCFRVLLTEIVWPFLRSVTRCWNKKKPKVSKQCSKRSHSSFYLKSNSFRSSLEKCKIFGRKIVVKNFQKWPNLVTLVVGLMPDIIFRANFVAPRGECYKTFYRFPPKFRNWTWGFCYAWTFTKKVNSWQVLNKNII